MTASTNPNPDSIPGAHVSETSELHRTVLAFSLINSRNSYQQLQR
jgi:hypothetical protein